MNVQHDKETHFLELEKQPCMAAPDGALHATQVGPEQATLCGPLYSGVGREWGWQSRLRWSTDDWSELLRDPAIQFWLVSAQESVLGYFELERAGDGSVEIVYLGLLGEARGKGLGRALVQTAIAKAYQFGATRIWLKTSSTDHPRALRTYSSAGFRIVSSTRTSPTSLATTGKDNSAPWKATLLGVLHCNPWFSVALQSVVPPSGAALTYYTIHHAGPSVGIVARQRDRFLLIHQYRFIVGRYVWAIPSGGVEGGETPATAAARELQEETGLVAQTLTSLGGYHPSYGCSDQWFELFLADIADDAEQDAFDQNEVIRTKWVTRSELIELISQNGLVDGLSLVPLLRVVLFDTLAQLHQRDAASNASFGANDAKGYHVGPPATPSLLLGQDVSHGG